jgi:hypothetical protein
VIRTVLFSVLLFLTVSNFSYGQYLTYKDFIDILEIADDVEEVQKFLESKEFEYVDVSERDDDVYVIEYNKVIGDDEDNFIRIISNQDDDTYMVGEYSANKTRWDYYKTIIEYEQYELSDKRTVDGVLFYDFVNDDYKFTLSVVPDEDGEKLFRIFFQKE